MTPIVRIKTSAARWISERAEDVRDLLLIFFVLPLVEITVLDDQAGNPLGAILLTLFVLVFVALFVGLLPF